MAAPRGCPEPRLPWPNAARHELVHGVHGRGAARPCRKPPLPGGEGAPGSQDAEQVSDGCRAAGPHFPLFSAHRKDPNFLALPSLSALRLSCSPRDVTVTPVRGPRLWQTSLHPLPFSPGSALHLDIRFGGCPAQGLLAHQLPLPDLGQRAGSPHPLHHPTVDGPLCSVLPGA